MNIFYTSTLPSECASGLDDKRLVKMVLETAQLLSTTMSVLPSKKPLTPPYRITHQNHPCAVWARSSQANYIWLVNLFGELSNEYTRRFNKTHKCLDHIYTFAECIDYLVFPELNPTPHPNCTPFKDTQDTILAYRRYFNEVKWADGKARFTKANIPRWASKDVQWTKIE